MIASIVTLLDGSPPSSSAMHAAAFLAQRASAHLRGLFIEDERQFSYFPPVTAIGVGMGTAPAMPVPLPQAEYRKVEQEVQILGEQIAAEFEAARKKFELPGSFASSRGDVIDEMVAAARRNGLVVMGCRRKEAPEGATNPSSKIEPLLRATPRPLLLTPAGTWLREPDGRVLLAFDGSTASLRALPLAGWLARLLNAAVDVVVVDDDRERVNALHEEAEEFLKPFAVEVALIAQTGRVSKRLTDLAGRPETRALVMGGFGHNRISEWIFGSTTTNVLEHLPCPVLLTRP